MIFLALLVQAIGSDPQFRTRARLTMEAAKEFLHSFPGLDESLVKSLG